MFRSWRKFVWIGVGSIFVFLVLVIVLAVVAQPEGGSQRDEAQAEERRLGLHCIPLRHHPELMALVQAQLKDPNSMEVHETRIGPAAPGSDGVLGHAIVMEFGARNAFGGMVRHTARGWVDHETCTATLEWVR